MSVLLQEYDPTRGESGFSCAVSVKGPAAWCRWRTCCRTTAPVSQRSAKQGGGGRLGLGQEDSGREFLHAWYCHVSEGASGEEGMGERKIHQFL